MDFKQMTNTELMLNLEIAYVHQDWANYDVIFEEMRERGLFA